jgi:hypothetical protein
VALNQIQPYIDPKTKHLKMGSVELLLSLLQLAVGDQDIQIMAKAALLKLQRMALVFSQYYAEFQ